MPGDPITAFNPQPGGAFGWCSRGSFRLTTVAESRHGRASGPIERAPGGTWRRAETTRQRSPVTRRRAAEAPRLTENPVPYRHFRARRSRPQSAGIAHMKGLASGSFQLRSESLPPFLVRRHPERPDSPLRSSAASWVDVPTSSSVILNAESMICWRGPVVCTHVGKYTIYGVKELPHRFKRRVPGTMKRLDDAIGAAGTGLCAGHRVLHLFGLDSPTVATPIVFHVGQDAKVEAFGRFSSHVPQSAGLGSMLQRLQP